MDIISVLADRGMYHIVEAILVAAGHDATKACLAVSKRWNEIVSKEIAPISKLLLRQMNTHPRRQHSYKLLGWTDKLLQGRFKDADAIFRTVTDIKWLLRRPNRRRPHVVRYTSGTLIKCFLVHRRLLICGCFGGDIKLWRVESKHEAGHSRPWRVLIGHNDTVTCIDALDTTLVSGSQDFTVRLWDLETGSPVRVLRPEMRYLTTISLTEAHLIIVNRCASDTGYAPATGCRANVWQINRAWFDLDGPHTYPLDGPPRNRVLRHHLAENRIAVARDDGIKVFEVSDDSDTRATCFKVIFSYQHHPSIKILDVRLVHNLFLFRTLNDLRLIDINAEEAVPKLAHAELSLTVSMPDRDPTNMMMVTPFGFLYRPYREQCLMYMWHWEDFLHPRYQYSYRSTVLPNIVTSKRDVCFLFDEGVAVLCDQEPRDVSIWWFKSSTADDEEPSDTTEVQEDLK